MSTARGRRRGAEASRQRDLSLKHKTAFVDDKITNGNSFSVVIYGAAVTGSKNETLVFREACCHQLVGVAFAIGNMDDFRACSLKPGFGDVDASLPPKKLLVDELLRLPSGHVVLAFSAAWLPAAGKYFGVCESQWSSPVLCVDEERKMQRKAWFPGVEVPNLLRISMPKCAIRGVVNGEH
jgi:hypothetical protein